MWMHVAQVGQLEHALNRSLDPNRNFNMKEQNVTLDARTNRSMKHDKISTWKRLTIHLIVEDV
jgi:hypothetical protein